MMLKENETEDALDGGLEWEVEEEDLEEAAKAGRPPRKALRYRLRVDRDHFVVTTPTLSGRQILTIAGKQPPERFLLTQKFTGGRAERVGLDEAVDLRRPGVERFMTLPKDQTEG